MEKILSVLPTVSFCILTNILTSSTAHAKILSIGTGTAVRGDRNSNLVKNGSFENRAPGDPTLSTTLFWSGQPGFHTPFDFGLSIPGLSNDDPTYTIPNWVQTSDRGAYGVWGPPTPGFSAPSCGDGVACLYFGNWIMTPNPTPNFQNDGIVTFTSPPTFTNTVTKNQAPVTLSQTLTGLTVGATYLLDFWTSGEFDNGRLIEPSVFGLSIGSESVFLTVPSPLSVFNADSIRYYVYFTATNNTESISFINWGHISEDSQSTTATELVLDDVIVNNVSIPEPSLTWSFLALAGSLVAISRCPSR